MKLGKLPPFIILAGMLAASAFARVPALTDDQVHKQIIHQLVSDYLAPLCYPGDVSAGMMADWRRRGAQ